MSCGEGDETSRSPGAVGVGAGPSVAAAVPPRRTEDDTPRTVVPPALRTVTTNVNVWPELTCAFVAALLTSTAGGRSDANQPRAIDPDKPYGPTTVSACG